MLVSETDSGIVLQAHALPIQQSGESHGKVNFFQQTL